MRRVECGFLAFALALLLAPALRAGEPEKEESRPHVTLIWSTASEVDNFGYFVMRGDDEKGPFKALNEKAIPGAGNSDMPHDYRYEDFAVTPEKTYWYFLESVSTSGVREKFSPVLKRQCCRQLPADGKQDGPRNEPKKEPAGSDAGPKRGS